MSAKPLRRSMVDVITIFLEDIFARQSLCVNSMHDGQGSSKLTAGFVPLTLLTHA